MCWSLAFCLRCFSLILRTDLVDGVGGDGGGRGGDVMLGLFSVLSVLLE